MKWWLGLVSSVARKKNVVVVMWNTQGKRKQKGNRGNNFAGCRQRGIFALYEGILKGLCHGGMVFLF